MPRTKYKEKTTGVIKKGQKKAKEKREKYLRKKRTQNDTSKYEAAPDIKKQIIK